MTEASPARKAEQARSALGLADAVSALRLPLAVLFIVCHSTPQRLSILAAAAVTDLLDGWIARWLGPSRLGAFVDPVADKFFMASAFGVVAFSGALEWYEVVGVLLRDIAASLAFFITAVLGRPSAIPARAGGKEVTVAQVLEFTAKHHGLSVEDLTGKRRTGAISQARQIAMFLAREFTSSSLPQIGVAFGGRKHSTVLYSCNKIADDIERDPKVRAAVKDIWARLLKAGE